MKRYARPLLILWLAWLVACGAAEPSPTARPRADQIATATQVALAAEAAQAARAATATALAQPTATATPTEAPTATPTRTPTRRPATATAPPTRTPAPAPTPGATASGATAGEVVLADDDLTQTGHGWLAGPPCVPGNLQQITCRDEAGLHLLFPQPGKWGKLWHQALPEVADLRVDLTTRVVENPEGTGGYGILCRYQANGDGYILRVWADGRFAVYRLSADRELRLGGSGDTPNPAVATGLAENRLHFECVGNTFVIAANGVELLRVEDEAADLGPGKVLLYACTCRGGTLDVAYSHIRIVAPAAPPASPAPPRGLPTRVTHAPPWRAPLVAVLSDFLARPQRMLRESSAHSQGVFKGA